MFSSVSQWFQWSCYWCDQFTLTFLAWFCPAGLPSLHIHIWGLFSRFPPPHVLKCCPNLKEMITIKEAAWHPHPNYPSWLLYFSLWVGHYLIIHPEVLSPELADGWFPLSPTQFPRKPLRACISAALACFPRWWKGAGGAGGACHCQPCLAQGLVLSLQLPLMSSLLLSSKKYTCKMNERPQVAAAATIASPSILWLSWVLVRMNGAALLGILMWPYTSKPSVPWILHQIYPILPRKTDTKMCLKMEPRDVLYFALEFEWNKGKGSGGARC